MSSMQLRRDDVIVGVDTHKDEHVAVLLDGLGGRLAELPIPATLAGFAQLLAFCLAQVGDGGRLVARGTPADVLTPALLADAFGVRAHVVPHPASGRPQLLFDRLESQEDSHA